MGSGRSPFLQSLCLPASPFSSILHHPPGYYRKCTFQTGLNSAQSSVISKHGGLAVFHALFSACIYLRLSKTKPCHTSRQQPSPSTQLCAPEDSPHPSAFISSAARQHCIHLLHLAFPALPPQEGKACSVM